MKATINRGEDEDTILLDWTNTVLHPNFVTGIFVRKGREYTHYPHPSNPIKFTIRGPSCNGINYSIKVAYNVTDHQGRNLCYATEAKIPNPDPKEFMTDMDVPVEKEELSENTYRVERLPKDLFKPKRYEDCLTYGPWQAAGNKFYFVEIPFCSQIEVNYRFDQVMTRKNVKKTLYADCDHVRTTEASTDSASGSGWFIGFMYFFAALAVVVSSGLYVWKNWEKLNVPGGVLSRLIPGRVLLHQEER